MALSLSEFRVNITLLTDGGQRVTLYTVSVCEYVCACVRVCRTIHCVHAYIVAFIDYELFHKPSQVEIRGVNYTGLVESSDQSWVSVLVNQLDQNFTKGETHTVRVFATNSVGTSNSRSTFQVPCES